MTTVLEEDEDDDGDDLTDIDDETLEDDEESLADALALADADARAVALTLDLAFTLELLPLTRVVASELVALMLPGESLTWLPPECMSIPFGPRLMV